MSLPPGFLEELRERVSLSSIVGRRVQWDLRKSNQAKGDFWAPCPFHQEKSASFHVMDQKGFYYCFGCQAKGDAISFLREQDGMGFMEAVEALASEAGMEMPARDPKAAERRDRRRELGDVLEGAARHYAMMLRGKAGQGARDYLASRGLTDEDIARFEIGYAPDGRDAILRHLKDKGVGEADVIDAGLAAQPESGTPYDRFRDRIVFPIRDARDRVISLGGRAMSAESKAKYLNGPETILFDKGRSLYNHGPAREASAKGAQLYVAEGYMDVIALVRGGLEAAVAPLGTAITEDQLQLLWRMHDEPVVALDGDAAGMRAAMRLVQIALPMLGPGRSLHFAVLPEGRDPDDILRDDGADALKEALSAPIPLVEMLWRRETTGRDLTTPERRAALDAGLREALRAIPDRTVRRHYGDALAERRTALFGTAPIREPERPRGRGGRARRDDLRLRGGASPATRATPLAQGGPGGRWQVESLVLAVLLRHPELVHEFEDALSRLTMSEDHAGALSVLIDVEGDRAEAEARLGADALDAIAARPHLRPIPALREGCAIGEGRRCLETEIARLRTMAARSREIEEARADMEALPDEIVAERLRQVALAADRAGRTQETARETVVAENGVRIDPAERGRMDALLGGIDYGRAGKKPRSGRH